MKIQKGIIHWLVLLTLIGFGSLLITITILDNTKVPYCEELAFKNYNLDKFNYDLECNFNSLGRNNFCSCAVYHKPNIYGVYTQEKNLIFYVKDIEENDKK